MTRKDSLILLHERLISKRDALRKKLVEEIDLLQATNDGVGDVGDAANDGARNEIDSQLAALESRELTQIENAIEMIRDGRYGICEGCDHAIPMARLKALPFTPTCVECQRQQEETGLAPDELDADWESAYEFEGHIGDNKELTLGDLDLEG